MAGLRILGLLVLAVAVPLVYSVGCPDNFYRIGDICLSLLQTDDQTFTNAEAKCKTLNSEATLAIVKDYRTQAQIVTFMMSLDNTQDVYIGLKATPTNPFYTWSDGTALDVSFTRWGVGQPDGYAFLTDTEYCVVLDNSNEKQPGYWYDVPCTEQHQYICSRKTDDSDNNKPIPGPRCTGNFIPLGSACFYLYNDAAKNYDNAQAACQAISTAPQYEVNLATVLNGYESALVETLMYSFDVPSAWIGLKSNNNEFGWEIDYPIVYTNWGTDEPSGQTGEGCVRARIDGDNWDDTTCSDTAAYICRFDSLAMTYPTPDPAMVALPCPNSDWISQGENCYYFSDRKTDWGEANYRCMRMYDGAMLASITSSADNEFIYTTMKAKYPTELYVWIGLTRVQTGNDNWGTFEWIDQKELNYALWSADQPDGNDPNAALLESCVAMSITSAGAGAWLDEICQFSLLYSVCKLPKQSTYQPRICSGSVDELKVGDQCYFPSTLLGPTQSDKTWTEAENKCREYRGHLTTVKDLDEQNLVRTLSFGFARSYWLGLRDEGAGFGWSDGTPFDISTDYSAFPNDQLPDNLADEEDCTELRIWQNGEWGRSACGNLLKFVCQREENTTTPFPPLPGYPDTGECPQDYFRLDNMCFNLRGTDESQRVGWIVARDACRDVSVAGTTLATVSNPGQQALLTAIIKGVGADMWIGLNGIGIHDQYHWTDTTRLDYTSWAPGQPDNALPITDPNSASCVAMMNDPNDPGLWNDAMCTTPRAYLCQSPLVPNGGDPPPLPGNPCTDSKYSSYFDTCFLMESTNTRSFDAARADCQTKNGDLLSVNDQYAGALFTYLLYQAGTDLSDDEAWLGLRRNSVTGVFEWIDKWPLQFTKWGPNEPNNNNGDCVALTRDGFWAVRQCDAKKFYFCKYPSTPPDVPGLKGGICPPDYVEFPGSDDCYLFDTTATTIQQEAGDLTCAINHDGGILPSIHSKVEEDFVKAEAKKVFGENAQIWLGVTRNADDFNTWFDQSLMDYVNWDAGEPTDDNNANNNGVLLDVNGGWSDVASTERHNYICKSPKSPAPPTSPPIVTAAPPEPGCPDNFYRIGDICLSLLSTDDQTFAGAETKCRTLNSKATLAIVKDYRTQAQIVTFMMSLDNTQDVYIGLKATPTNPFYTWSDGTALDVSFTRWGVGQPDGYAFLTDIEYCVVLDNSNAKQPGYWYDVPCTEQHKYICSMEVDDTITTGKPIPARRCDGNFIALGTACFYLYNSAPKKYDDAQAACRAISPGGKYEVNLATVLNGYESALVETLLYSYDVPYAWIGLKSDNNEFRWEFDYPIVYTNWGTDEPSGQTGEGCVRARIDGDNWDDTTCADTAAYICRFDSPALTYPTPDPDLVKLPCPNDDWISQGENCYFFSDRETDWGEANYRCMRMYEGAMLASITSSADNQFIYERAKAKYPAEQFVWIGLTRVQTGSDNWGTFEWIDQEQLNYALWSAAEPDGNDPNAALLESCVAMSITTAGAGAWLDQICQFSALNSVCKLPKASTYQPRLCGGTVEELQVGDQCYFPSTILGPTQSDKTWTEAENTCREYGGHLTTVKDLDEQNLVRTLSFGFARSYWLGLRDEGTFRWSDGTAFNINTDYSAFPNGQLPDNLADEEDCTELRIWQYGEWGRSACGNSLKFVCKREKTSTSPLQPLPGYPDSGECPQNYFRLDDMCFNLRETQMGWIAARDDCKTTSVAGTTLATVSNPGQQALLTAIIKGVSGDMWIGLNGIGIHDQYHWTDATRLDYTSWAPGQPDNALPITDPNSASCVAMMNDPNDPGLWNDATCTTPRAYLCQSPLVSSGGDPPPLPGNQCTDTKYSNYFDTCFLMENTYKRSFEQARINCESRDGSLLSVNDRYAGALFTYLLYQAGTDASDDEAWLGLRRNSDTGVFEWIDEWPLQFTRWGPNEPNNNNGDCVALTRDGFWAVRQCSVNNFYFCKYPSTPPEVPGLKGGICPPDYVEFPGSDDCYLFKTPSTTIKQEAGDLTCATSHNGGQLPSIHSKAEEDFVKAEAKKVFGENAQIWLGVTRNADEFNTWFDQSLMNYVNWDVNEPTDDNDANNNGVLLDVNGGWSDVASTERHNYICKSSKFPAPPTDPPKPTSSAIKPVAGWLSILLTGAAILFARR